MIMILPLYRLYRKNYWIFTIKGYKSNKKPDLSHNLNVKFIHPLQLKFSRFKNNNNMSLFSSNDCSL